MKGILRGWKGSGTVKMALGCCFPDIPNAYTTSSPLSAWFLAPDLHFWHHMTLATTSHTTSQSWPMGMKTSTIGRPMWSRCGLVWELLSVGEMSCWTQHVFSLCKCEYETCKRASPAGYGRNQDMCREMAENRFHEGAEAMAWRYWEQKAHESRQEQLRWGKHEVMCMMWEH